VRDLLPECLFHEVMCTKWRSLEARPRGISPCRSERRRSNREHLAAPTRDHHRSDPRWAWLPLPGTRYSMDMVGHAGARFSYRRNEPAALACATMPPHEHPVTTAVPISCSRDLVWSAAFRWPSPADAPLETPVRLRHWTRSWHASVGSPEIACTLGICTRTNRRSALDESGAILPPRSKLPLPRLRDPRQSHIAGHLFAASIAIRKRGDWSSPMPKKQSGAHAERGAQDTHAADRRSDRPRVKGAGEGQAARSRPLLDMEQHPTALGVSSSWKQPVPAAGDLPRSRQP